MASARSYSVLLEYRRTHNYTLTERLTLGPTVGRDLAKRRFAQRFLVVPW